MSSLLDNVELYSDEWLALSVLAVLTPPRFWPALTVPEGGLDDDADLPDQVRNWIKGYVPDDGRSLLLMGPVGTGKTWLAYRVLRYLVNVELRGNNGHIQPYFTVNATTEDKLIKGRRASGSIDDYEFDRFYLRPKLLLLDELGVAKGSEFVEAEMSTLVDHRYSYLLTTIATTNVPTASLNAKLGDRVADRLREMCEVVIVAGASRRK